MIDFLNQGNDFGDLCDICCINEGINNEESIYTTEMLIYWNEKSALSEPIERFLNKIKAFIDEEFINDRDNGIILDADDKISIIKMIIRGTRHAGIILSRNAWEWIERENDLDILKKIALICIMKFSRNTHEAVVALLENRSMFYKYMIV